jgi:hypothetical protein
MPPRAATYSPLIKGAQASGLRGMSLSPSGRAFANLPHQTGSHDCRVLRGNRGFVRETPELPTIKRNLRV